MVVGGENARMARVVQLQYGLAGGAGHELGSYAFPAVIALHGRNGERAERVERGNAADQFEPVLVVLR